jgi:DNA-binding transcriptional LysR family regulator
VKRFNIRQVEAFRAVVALGGMTRAAEALGVSQPAVSRLIVDFQDAVGLKLFTRHRGCTEPTDDALRLFDRVEKLFVGLDELNQEVHAIKTLSPGRISIAAMGPYANGLLPQIIARFNAGHPDISISLTSQSQQRLLDWVDSRHVDIGFMTLPLTNSALPVRSVLRRPALCVFPAGHELEARPRVAAGDLSGRPFVSFQRGAPFRYEIDMMFERAGVERRLTIEASSHEAVCNLVAAGLGVSIVSPFSPHLRSNPALSFRPFVPAIPVELGMVGDPNRMSGAARAFYDFVLGYLKTQYPAEPASAAAKRLRAMAAE